MRKNFLFLIAIGLLATGCGVKAPIQPRNDPYLASQIHMDSDELRGDTAVGTPKLSRDDAGLLFVTIPIRSTINKTLYVDYYVTFLDKNGQPLSKLGPVTKVLQANTPDTITANSMSNRAEDFQIDFRYAK